jgi:hypothetical protein
VDDDRVMSGAATIRATHAKMTTRPIDSAAMDDDF